MSGEAEGYRNFQKNSTTYSGAIHADAYINTVSKEIEEYTKNINDFKGFETDTSRLKGDISEFWHSGTHNIDAAVKGIKTRTNVDRSHDFASADIVSSTGEKFGLKYMADGTSSARHQARSYFEKYSEFKSSSNKAISFDDFLSERNISVDKVLHSDPIYSGQIRVIPKEQMDEAITWLQRKIIQEGNVRPEQVDRYKATLDVLTDCVKTKEGAKSIPLTKDSAEKLANLAKRGEFDPSKFGMTTEELVEFKYIMQQSVQAGLSAGTISFVLKVAPQVYQAVEYLIQNGEIDEKEFKEIGFSALSGFSEGFIRGTVAAALTSGCKSGILGSSLKTVDPSVIGAVTVIFMNVMKNSYEVSQGRMTNRDMINELAKDMYISAFALVSAGITQSFIGIPIFGYMLGSFCGSMIGGLTYEYGYSKLISFCVETGFTFFGLVEQNYSLPNEVIKQLGFDIYELDKIELDQYNQDQFVLDNFELNQFELYKIELIFVRRGVIGLNRIGYV